MTRVQLFVRSVMQTPWCLGVMGFFLVFVPIIGILSSQIWLGTLGTIYKTTQMNPDEKRGL